MGHRQKGKGCKRKRSWHRLGNQDRLYRRAIEALDAAQQRAIEYAEVDDREVVRRGA
ncbi:hypothetical protein [Mycobacterium phage Y10]|uniref:Uncharacterized protein n=7 Tax=Fionnbharthvirus TaxID=2948708 RepID=A0A2Z5XAS7_9CAUD|nr:hypothetical protein ACQ59_gp61 [Mycobacterium phage Fionnbharth]YP_009215670.1 hypothetical protein PBI_CHEETOBRO_72 [Mycobacterium phage Cheetobro]YP_009950414.1 hypothetical protein I5G69_gp63 [Mycobacterium phage Eponine]YP_009950507.1 hypothetical protein I5G70_gp62 [Mycobacterium phage Taquito]ALA46343.1 hypothetical protein PBI_SLARP_72 [Mycobacterium phage Slarp]APD19199.1 hypothetical protein SEA_MITTI_72 [Mycobacterium phage Mitti]ASR87779.1 hypothetical protein WINTERMUTE_72 [My